MYHYHFGFHGKPFQSALPERAFFASASLRQVIPVALHTLRSDLGVAVLTGPAGIGKSTLLKHLERSLQTDGQSVVFSAGAMQDSAAMLGLLWRRLRAAHATADQATETSAKCGTAEHWQVVDRLAQTVDFWGPLIVLMDDAHLAGPEIFSELRALLEEEVDGRRLVRVLVSGALSLEDVLAAPAMTDFAQKIRSHVFLEPLRSNEAIAYLTTHLRAVGGDVARIFEPTAIGPIVAAADGVPRNLNLLADEALLVASEACSPQVTAAHVDTALRRLQHLPYAWNVSLADKADGESRDEPAETTDVAASPGSTFSSEGVIEIGAPVPGNVTRDQESVRNDAAHFAPEIRPAAAACGVIEVGAVDVSDAAAEFEAVLDPVACGGVADTDECSSDCETAVGELTEPSSRPRGNDGADSPCVNDGTDSPCGNDECASDCESPVESASVDAELAEDNELPRTALQELDLWMPPGSWPAHTSTTACSNDATAAVPTSSGWVRQDRDVTPMPVFDRYTWQEYGRDVSFADTIGRRYVEVPCLASVWPPDLTGLVPLTQIPIEDLGESLAVINLQRQVLSIEAAFDLTECDLDDDDLLPAAEHFAETAGTDFPDEKDSPVNSDDESDSIRSAEFERDVACRAEHDDCNDEIPDEPISASADLADESLGDVESIDDLLPWNSPLADPAEAPLQQSVHPSSDDDILPSFSDLYPLEFDDGEPVGSVAGSAEVVSRPPAWVSLFEAAKQPAEWHDGQLLDCGVPGTPDTQETAEENSSVDIISLPIGDSEQSIGGTEQAADDATSGLHEQQHSQVPKVERLFTLPVPISQVNLSRRDGAYSDLPHSPVTDALLRIDNAGDVLDSAPENAMGRSRKPDDEFVIDGPGTLSEGGYESEDEPGEAVLPDGRLSTDGKLRFETLFTRLRQRRPGGR